MQLDVLAVGSLNYHRRHGVDTATSQLTIVSRRMMGLVGWAVASRCSFWLRWADINLEDEHLNIYLRVSCHDLRRGWASLQASNVSWHAWNADDCRLKDCHRWLQLRHGCSLCTDLSATQVAAPGRY